MKGRFSRDIGIDLGTANTLVHVAGRGILIREPSVVAINKDTGKVLAVGEEAKRMLGRTPANIVATRPLRDGVIADYDHTLEMIRDFVRRSRRGMTLYMTVVVGIPSGVTEVERDAVLDACKKGYDVVFLLFRSPLDSAQSVAALSLCDKAIVTATIESTDLLTPFANWAYHEDKYRLAFIHAPS